VPSVLKRSKIFLLSLIGAVLPPLLMFIAVTSFDEGHSFEMLFANVNMYMSAMFAVLIFAIIISIGSVSAADTNATEIDQIGLK